MRKNLAVILCCSLLLTLFLGCRSTRTARPAQPATVPPASAQGIPRPDPGYIQWLKKQSLLHKATQLRQLVSDTNLQWRVQSSQPTPHTLVKEADAWLTVNPASVLTPQSKPLFTYLQGSSFWEQITPLGFTGLLVSPARDSGGIWGADISGTQSQGEDTVSFTFSNYVGSERDFRILMQKASRQNVIIGDTLIPAATGVGADFLLAIRGHEEFTGIYSLIEIPAVLWKNLPQPARHQYVTPLASHNIAELRKERILPELLWRDASGLPFTPVRWGVTAETKGVDGNIRRFAYLYYSTPDRPILNWTDPSSNARRILSASIIQATGSFGAALVGVQIAPLIGLEPAPATHQYSNAARPQQGPANSSSPESVKTKSTPSEATAGHATAEFATIATEAAATIAREVRRYGGWSYIRDPLPLPVLRNMQTHGPDFALDHATSVSAQYALLTGDASMLTTTIQAMQRLGIDRSRLIHTIQPSGGMDLSLIHLYDDSAPSLRRLRTQSAKALLNVITKAGVENMVDGTTLYTTPTGVVILAADIPNMEQLRPQDTQLLHDGMSTLALFHAMQPGLFFASGRDLAGTLPLPEGIVPATTQQKALQQNITGAYDLLGTAPRTLMTGLSIPKAHNAFPSLPEQSVYTDSFATKLRRTLLIRKQYGISCSVPLGLIPSTHRGVLLQLFALPAAGPVSGAASQNHLLVASNFSRTSTEEYLPLNHPLLREIPVTEAVDLLGDGLALNITPSAKTAAPAPQEKQTTQAETQKALTFSLAPWETRIILLETAQ